MTGLESELRTICAALTARRRGFALVGGLAVSTRAEPRLTRDADLAVSVADDADAEALIRDLAGLGYRVQAGIEHGPSGRLATVRLQRTAARSTVTDLLFATCGFEPELVVRADQLEVLPGFMAPVASIGHLIAMKLLARDDRNRPLDADDLRALRSLADEAAWVEAGVAVGLSIERGFARGRDLRAALQELRAEEVEDEAGDA